MLVWGPKRIQIKKLSTTKFHNFSRSTTFVLEVSSSEIVYEIWSSLCRVPRSGIGQTFFLFFCFLLFLFFLFPSYFILPNWLPCTLNILIKFTQLYIFNSSTHIIALSYAVIDQNSIYINSIIALDTLKLSSGSKKLPKFYTKQYILSIEKFLKSNPNLIVTSTPNLTASFSTLWFFFADVSIYKHRTWQNCETHSSFYHSLHI